MQPYNVYLQVYQVNQTEVVSANDLSGWENQYLF